MEAKKIVKGKVIGIYPTHALVRLNDSEVGILHISQVSDYFVFSLENIFKLNDTYWFEIIDIDKKESRISLSWKNIVPRFLKNPFEFNLVSTPKGFNNLSKMVKEKINAF